MNDDDDNDGQMIFVDLGGLNHPNIYLTGEENPRKNLTQETCPDRGSNPGPLRGRRACYRLAHSGGLYFGLNFQSIEGLRVLRIKNYSKYHTRHNGFIYLFISK